MQPSDDPRSPQAIRAVVEGRVQGVGFRMATVAAARRLGVAGWCRNRTDGSVEIFAQGPPGPLDEFRSFLWHGPSGARVGACREERVAARPDVTDFSIRF